MKRYDARNLCGILNLSLWVLFCKPLRGDTISTQFNVETNCRLLHKKCVTTRITIKNNNMKKLEDLSELPENMLEIKEDRSEISLKDLIDNFYT